MSTPTRAHSAQHAAPAFAARQAAGRRPQCTRTPRCPLRRACCSRCTLHAPLHSHMCFGRAGHRCKWFFSQADCGSALRHRHAHPDVKACNRLAPRRAARHGHHYGSLCSIVREWRVRSSELARSCHDCARRQGKLLPVPSAPTSPPSADCAAAWSFVGAIIHADSWWGCVCAVLLPWICCFGWVPEEEFP